MSDQSSTATIRRIPGPNAWTVEIAGRTFPTVGLVCPPDEIDPDRPDKDRSLGTGNDWLSYIPAENGVIFVVEKETAPAAPPNTLRLSLLCAVCEQSYDPEGYMWLPKSVSLIDGQLLPTVTYEGRLGVRAVSDWHHAEPEWVAETIDRLSRLPFTEPDGPRCRLVPRDAFDADNGS